MIDEQTEIRLKRKIRLKRLVRKKCREFEKNGYQKIIEEDFWQYLLAYRWKRNKMVNYQSMKMDLKSVSINEYFDYQVIKAQTMSSDMFDWNEIDDLLK